MADSCTLYLKTHNYHWNVTGPVVQTLHLMFETQHDELALQAAKRHQTELEAKRPKLLELYYADLDQIREADTETERRTLLDEYISAVQVYGDHLEVEVRGAPKINVALQEVGLRNRSLETAGVGRPVGRFTYRSLAARIELVNS